MLLVGLATTLSRGSREELIGKARDLIVPVLGAAKFERLVEKIFALETVKNVTELRPLLQAG